MTIVKRATKGSALTYSEMDENIRDLYEDTTLLRALTNGTGSAAQVKGTTVGIVGGSGANANNANSRHGPIVDIYRDVNRADEVGSLSTPPLGAIAFSGHNADDEKVSYASIYTSIGQTNGDAGSGAHSGSRIVFTIADGTNGSIFNSYLDQSFKDGHAIVLNASADRLHTTGYLDLDDPKIQMGYAQEILASAPYDSLSKPFCDFHLPDSIKAKVFSCGGIGPSDAWLGANLDAAAFLRYRGQHVLRYSGSAVEIDLPAVASTTTISTTTANIGDVWQISNAGSAGSITLDRDGSGTAQAVYWVNGSSLVPFTNNPTIGVGGSLMLQAVATNIYMIFNATALTDA